MDLLLVAWRYLVARPITLVSTLSVTVGLAAIVVVDSVMNGFLAEQRSMIRALSPDVSVDVGDLPAGQAEALLAELRAMGEVRAASPRVEVPAIHGEADEPSAMMTVPGHGDEHFLNLIGIDPAEALHGQGVIDFARFLAHERCEYAEQAGRFGADSRCPLRVRQLDAPFSFDPSDPFWRSRMDDEYRHRDDLIPVVFGEELASRFGYRVGSVITASTFAGDPWHDERLKVRQHQFVVAGAFVTRDRHFDVTHALVPRDRLAEFAGLVSPLQELAVAAAPGLSEPALRDLLRGRLAGVAAAAIQTWADRRSLLLGAVENERRVMNVAMFFVVIVATFSLFVTLHQMVRRKTRDIGVLAALGAPPLHAGRLFALCGLIVTGAGALFGFVGGLLLTRWLNPLLDGVERATGWRLFDPRIFQFEGLPIRVDLGRIGWYALATVACGTLFTLLPSLRAARLDPVEALRHE